MKKTIFTKLFLLLLTFVIAGCGGSSSQSEGIIYPEEDYSNSPLRMEIKNGHTDRVNSVAFSPDGKIIASASFDSTVKLWTIKGRLIKTLKGHHKGITCVAYSPDGRSLISGSADTTNRVWNIETGESVAMLSMGKKWLQYTDDGYWDSSPKGGELVAMVQGLNVFGIDQFAIKNNRPDIILKRLGSKNKKLINHYYRLYKKRLKKAGLTEGDLSSNLHVPTAKIVSRKKKGKFVKLKFNLRDSKYNLKNYNIYVNNVPLFGAYGKAISGSSKTINHRVELTSGINKIEVACFNEKGVESYRDQVSVRYKKKVKGNLYFLGFGVSEYENINGLKYAHQDAIDLKKVFNKMKGRQFKKVFTKVYINSEVTTKNIKQAKSFLNKAKVDDTFVLFIAGHGMQDKESNYYYLTYNTDLKNISGTAANFDLIEGLLQGIKPRKKLFLMDTCQSGEADEVDEMAPPGTASGNTRGLRARAVRGATMQKKVSKSQAKKRKKRRKRLAQFYQKDRYIYNDLLRRSGSIVFSSSKGAEYSHEHSKWKNGIFTEVIVQCLTEGKGDKNGDGIISTNELRRYVSKKVPKVVRKIRYPGEPKVIPQQHPTVDRDNIYQKFGFPVSR